MFQMVLATVKTAQDTTNASFIVDPVWTTGQCKHSPPALFSSQWFTNISNRREQRKQCFPHPRKTQQALCVALHVDNTFVFRLTLGVRRFNELLRVYLVLINCTGFSSVFVCCGALSSSDSEHNRSVSIKRSEGLMCLASALHREALGKNAVDILSWILTCRVEWPEKMHMADITDLLHKPQTISKNLDLCLHWLI